ncbi:MAG: S1 RNA-binding domain-containing protein [Myxococcota bacterium]
MTDAAAESVAPEPIPQYLDGTFRSAKVLNVESDRIIVSVSERARAEIPSDEFGATPAVGDTFTVFVDTTIRRDPLRYVASKEKADRIKPFDELAKAHESGTPVSGEVVSAIEGGFDVDVMGVRAFLPASQVGLRPVRNQFEVLGHTFNFKIIRFNKSRYNVVLSLKVLLGAARKQTFTRLREGAIVEGVVRSVVDFGAFVDLGAVEGLLHVTDMSYGRLGHPSKLVDVGDKLTVKVLKIDKKNRRISLGLKQLEDDPWVGADERYPKGKQVRGLVVSKTDFGCFIEVEPGLDGLVISKGPMVSEAAQAKLKRTDIGDEIEAEVLDIDLAGHRFSLRLKEDD